MNIAICCCCYGSSLRPAFSHIILHECVHAVRVRLKLRLHISADWTRWFLNTIVVCSRYYFNSHSSFKVQFLPFVFSACHFISYALILRLSLTLDLYPRTERFKAFNIRLCCFALLLQRTQDYKQPKRPFHFSVCIYLHIIDRGQILGNWMLFCVLRWPKKKLKIKKEQALKNIRRRAHIASHQEKPIHMCL